MTCHRCQTLAFKFGIQNGFQRYRCKTCKKTFSDIPAKPLDDLRIEPEKAFQIVRMLCEGVGVRASARLAGVHRDTVLNILETAGHKAMDLLEERVKNIEAKYVSIDEMYGFVGCLQQNTTVDDQLRGDQYTFLSMEQTTKLILNWHVGKRDKENALAFLNGLKAKTVGRFQLTSDGFAPYSGYLGGVFQVFRDSVDYGVETKTFGCAKSSSRERIPRRLNPVVCLGVHRVAKIGKPKRSMMTTNLSERCNLSLRLFNRRSTRKTLGFSKTLRNHKLAVALQVAYFNFCRPHSALKIKATETTPAKEQTPAMAQGLANHIWNVEELLDGTTLR